MLKKRVATALVMLVILIAAIWFDEPVSWFTILAGVWGLLTLYEFYKLTGVSKSLSLTAFGLLWMLFLIVTARYSWTVSPSFLLTSVIILSLIVLLFRQPKEGAWAAWSWMMAGLLYLGWLLRYLVLLRVEGGREWIVLALFVTFASDSAAYFVGKSMGKHHMAPQISPNKTWEGASGGLVGAVIASVVLVIIFKGPLTYAQAVLFGIIISIIGQLGDLVKSLLKRNIGVKDSGSILPGHGGMLDRTDSPLFAGVAAYVFLLAFNSGWLNWL